MKSIVLLGLVLGSLMLTSCTNTRVTEVIPHKTFQYSYQDPTRIIINAPFSKYLTTGKAGQVITVNLKSQGRSSVRLGHHYFSANGNNCRKYSVNNSYENIACNINSRWYYASPIVISKQN